jgi:hypothetical protein
VTNNSRFLILPERSVPNLASKVLRLSLDRLATDWQSSYGHPVLVVETFVYVAQFSGTVYSASGWSELGQTDGWGGAVGAIATLNTISPNTCSAVRCAKTPAAVSRPNISNQP